MYSVGLLFLRVITSYLIHNQNYNTTNGKLTRHACVSGQHAAVSHIAELTVVLFYEKV